MHESVSSYVPVFLCMTFPLMPNQVHTGHNLVHVFYAMYPGLWDMKFSTLYIHERAKHGLFNDIQFTWSCVVKTSTMDGLALPMAWAF